MKINGKLQSDETLIITFEISKAERESIQKSSETIDSVPENTSLFFPNPFERKTDYCVSCPDGRRETIWAYGDIHAGIVALGA